MVHREKKKYSEKSELDCPNIGTTARSYVDFSHMVFFY